MEYLPDDRFELEGASQNPKSCKIDLNLAGNLIIRGINLNITSSRLFKFPSFNVFTEVSLDLETSCKVLLVSSPLIFVNKMSSAVRVKLDNHIITINSLS